MTVFNWYITSMNAYPQEGGEQDVVFQVNWSCNADDGDSGFAQSVGSVSVAYTAGTPFTPYDQLTQEQVWGWINPSINRSAVEADLQAMIDKQKAPAVVTPPLPWEQQGVQP
jgi:hypothetical protein